MKACWILKCIPKSLSICTHYVNWYLISNSCKKHSYLMYASHWKKIEKCHFWDIFGGKQGWHIKGQIYPACPCDFKMDKQEYMMCPT